jgi:two-component system, NarL family, sensor histidine kinase UhpB
MWQRLSLRARLNALLAIVLLLGLIINISRLLFEAAPRVQAEDQSVVRLARQFIETSVAGLNGVPHPETRLERMVEELNRLRHVSVVRSDAGTPAAKAAADRQSSAPAWFIALVHPEQTSAAVPVTFNGKLESLIITSHPDDEIDEIWDSIVTQLGVGSAIVIALLLVTMTVVRRALSPIETLAAAMSRIESGDYETRVKPRGSPELAGICDKLNHLASALGKAVEDKRQLAERIVSLQDVERKEIARELHDEFGPYHFALRAHAEALLRIAAKSVENRTALLKHGTAMLQQVEALQRANRRVLDRLRPAGLAELGLGEALGALVQMWREAHPDVVIETSVSQPAQTFGETIDLTVYRIVQEALTNVFRHASATRVSITIEPANISRITGPEQALLVRIRDNGSGLPDRNHKPGQGLVGMRERVMALGGTISVMSTEDGVIIEAMVPMRQRAHLHLSTETPDS